VWATTPTRRTCICRIGFHTCMDKHKSIRVERKHVLAGEYRGPLRSRTFLQLPCVVSMLQARPCPCPCPCPSNVPRALKMSVTRTLQGINKDIERGPRLPDLGRNRRKRRAPGSSARAQATALPRCMVQGVKTCPSVSSCTHGAHMHVRYKTLFLANR
jgi:hypothetical protein